eukprot:5780661-Amphidinium_carterae.1
MILMSSILCAQDGTRTQRAVRRAALPEHRQKDLTANIPLDLLTKYGMGTGVQPLLTAPWGLRSMQSCSTRHLTN